MIRNKRAVFIDRDGVLIEDIGLLKDLKDVRVFSNVPAALGKMKERGYELIIVSNQPIVARGIIDEDAVRKINDRIILLLKEKGSPDFDGFYFCPHHPNANLPEYRINCDCRKPRPGLLIKAAGEHDIDLAKSFMIGDRITDIIAGHSAGCRTILVKTGRHNEPPIETSDAIDLNTKADFECENLKEAADWILSQK